MLQIKSLFFKNFPSLICRVYKEHFIHAKYARKEFETEGGTAHYEIGNKTGQLWKRGKEDKQFKPRRFVLNTDEGTLKYYIKQDVRVQFVVYDILCWQNSCPHLPKRSCGKGQQFTAEAYNYLLLMTR